MQVRIGVDELFQTHRRPGRWWCHLLCDDFSPAGLQQLHGFAARMGLHTRAFHDPPGRPRPHYDLTPEMREVALQMGALQLTMRQVVEFLELGRGRRTNDSGNPPPP
jgi:hypothetical protein